MPDQGGTGGLIALAIVLVVSIFTVIFTGTRDENAGYENNQRRRRD